MFETTSICKVIEGFPSKPDDYLLKRIFDVDVDKGTVHRVILQDYVPKYFGNRDRIYKNDGPEELGTIGVWTWNSRPNYSDPDRDYVHSSYQPQIHIVFVKILKDVDSLEELVEKLKNGVDLGFRNACKEQWMVLFKDTAGDYTGVYCERGTLEGYGGSEGTSGYIKRSVTQVPTVSIGASDIYKLDDQRIYHYLDVDPIGEVLIQSVNEIVKNCIIDRVTWKAFNSFSGGSHTEHNLFKEFLKSITVDIYQEVSEKCGCDRQTAEEYVDGFIGIANTYIDGEDIETNVLVSLVEGNNDLRERFERIIEERWIENNKKRIEKNKAELDLIKEEKEQIEIEINTLKGQQESEEKNYLDSVNLHKKYLEDLEVEVNKKIDMLKGNLGSALADSIYYEQIFSLQKSIEQKNEETSFFPGIEAVVEEELENAQDVVDLLSYNLVEAGVCKDYAEIVSAFLTASIHNSSSLILAGPNGKEIADAISLTLFGRSAGRYISWNNTEIINTLSENEEPVVIFDSFCKTEIVDILPEVISGHDKLCIFITPYHEDLAIEPLGLFNYALPLMTEWFVDSYPHREWVGGMASNDWGDSIEKRKVRRSFIDGMKSIGMKQYQRKKYLRVLEEAISITDQSDREDYLGYFTVLLPFSIVTGNLERLYELIEDDESIEESVRVELLKICGE